MAVPGRFRELLKKYGKVALGVHLSVSAASITGLYVAIKNNVDVEAVLHRVGLSSAAPSDESPSAAERPQGQEGGARRNRTAELAASSGGALALAVLCNKALFPVRVPITVALTPPVARFLSRRNLLKNGVTGGCYHGLTCKVCGSLFHIQGLDSSYDGKLIMWSLSQPEELAEVVIKCLDHLAQQPKCPTNLQSTNKSSATSNLLSK